MHVRLINQTCNEFEGNLLPATSRHDFPVVHGDSVIGLLTRAALVQAMMNEGPDGYVSAAMNRDFVRLSPDMPLADALPKLSGPAACALVMDADDRLMGMMTSEHVDWGEPRLIASHFW